MNLFETDISLLIVYLFAMNFVGILLINTEERFWLPGILIWVGLLTFLLIVRETNRKQLELKEFTSAQQQKPKVTEPGKPVEKSFDMKQAEGESSRKNSTIFHLLGSQTIFCFFWMLIGFAKTRRNYYKSGTLGFLLLSVIYVIVALLG